MGGTSDIIYVSPEGTLGINYLLWNSDGTQIVFAKIDISNADDYIKIIEMDTSTVTHTGKGFV